MEGLVGGPPEGTSELGIDIVRVARIRQTLEKFGSRFVSRVLTDREASYVRGRAETLAGRWAAKEAVSKVLGLGVRGIGWRDIEIERLPTGQPAVLLHGRASRRADQLGMTRIALSISHETDYAVAIAYGVRTTGGRYVFPVDLEARLDDRERRLMARMARLREEALALDEAERRSGRVAGQLETSGADGRDGGTPEPREKPG